MSSKKELLVGADPEFFIRDAVTTRPLIICGLLGGTKERPMPMQGLAKGFAYQEDNVMAEFNVPPTDSLHTFYNNIQSGLGYVVSILQRTNPNIQADPRCEILFPIAELNTHAKALEFGCSPDFDGWRNGEPCPQIDPAALVDGKSALRCAGGHLHFGYTSEIPHPIMAQFCDLLIGLPSLRRDKQIKRRALYGTPGRFRPTSYGIEYRTLSNFWLFDSHAVETIFMYGVDYLRWILTMSISEAQSLYRRIPWADVDRVMRANDVDGAAELTDYAKSEVFA